MNEARTASGKEKVRKHPKLAKASARLAVAAEAGGPASSSRSARTTGALLFHSLAAAAEESTPDGPSPVHIRVICLPPEQRRAITVRVAELVTAAEEQGGSACRTPLSGVRKRWRRCSLRGPLVIADK